MPLNEEGEEEEEEEELQYQRVLFALLFTRREKEEGKECIHAFPKGTSTKWNAINFFQNLNLRERERERETDRQTERERERERQTYRQTDRQRTKRKVIIYVKYQNVLI